MDRDRTLDSRQDLDGGTADGSADLCKDGPPRGVALFAAWGGRPDELAKRVEAASDWGPFELVEMWRANDARASGQPEYELRFAYHGGARDAEHLTDNFLRCVGRVAPWRAAIALNAV